MSSAKTFRVLPGFRLTLGYTLIYLSLLILIPLAAVFLKTAELSWGEFIAVVTAPQVVATYRLSFGASLLAAAINAVFGLLLAWALVRYSFPAKAGRCAGRPPLRVADGGGRHRADRPLCEERLARPVSRTARNQGCLRAARRTGGAGLHRPAVRRAYGAADPRRPRYRTGEAAASLGAQRWQTFRYVLLPILLPALLTGFALAFARAVGEYGSVIFIAGNLPLVSEITPLMIITKLEQYDYRGATAIASVMLLFSFVLLLLINGLQAWTAKTGRDR